MWLSRRAYVSRQKQSKVKTDPKLTSVIWKLLKILRLSTLYL